MGGKEIDEFGDVHAQLVRAVVGRDQERDSGTMAV
jgi:hypothetical protein